MYPRSDHGLCEFVHAPICSPLPAARPGLTLPMHKETTSRRALLPSTVSQCKDLQRLSRTPFDLQQVWT